jgi:S1-C subfamily serine protease
VFLNLSISIAELTKTAAPMLTAVRTGSHRHASGIRWYDDVVLVSDQALPAHDSFTVVLPQGRLVQARAVRRDSNLGLAALRLETADAMREPARAAAPATGALVIVLGAAFDATPTVRLAAIHRVGPTAGNHGSTSIVLDLPAQRLDAGSAVIDAAGCLLGLAGVDAAGEAVVIPYDVLARFVSPPQPIPQQISPAQPGTEPFVEPASRGVTAQPAAQRPGSVSAGRGWLGVALQPTTLPDALRQLAGQSSGRMVVSITPDGPADRAGFRLGDVLLALDGQSVSGSHALRAVVNAEKVGQRLEVKVLRDGAIYQLPLVVAAPPDR